MKNLKSKSEHAFSQFDLTQKLRQNVSLISIKKNVDRHTRDKIAALNLREIPSSYQKLQVRTSVIILYKLKEDSRNPHANLLLSEHGDIQHKNIEGINNSRKKKSATHLRGKTKNASRAQKCRLFALAPSAYFVHTD